MFPRDFVVASSVHVKYTDKGMTVKYEPSWSQKYIREKTQFFIQVLCDNSTSKLWKFSMGMWKKDNTVLNLCEFCFTMEISLVFLFLSKLLFSVLLFSVSLVWIKPFLHFILLCFFPFQSFTIYCMVSHRSKIFISVYILQTLCWQDKFVNFLCINS